MKNIIIMVISAFSFVVAPAYSQTAIDGAQIVDSAAHAVMLQCQSSQIPFYLEGHVTSTIGGKSVNHPEGIHQCRAAQSSLSAPAPTGSATTHGLTVQQCPAPFAPLVIGADKNAEPLTLNMNGVTYHGDVFLSCINWSAKVK
jgi:Tfp pilus assembly protein PilE